MEIRIGVVDSPKEINLEVKEGLDDLVKRIDEALTGGTSVLWLQDEKDRRIGIPAGKMSTYPEAFESEHGKHRKMRIDISHPLEGTVPNIGFPVKLSETPQQVRRHPPLLGEHTREVLAEAGLDDTEISGLDRAGAFAP